MQGSLKGRWPAKVLLALCLLPAALLGGEAITRGLFPQPLDSRMNIYEADAQVGFIHRPNATAREKSREYNVSYRINGEGLRDREYGAKTDRTFRVLLLGDSFSVSHGLEIEDSLSRQLERALQAAADGDGLGVQVQVVNAAVGGYSPFNYWKAYERWQGMYRADAVLVGLSPDDYDCSNADARYLIQDGLTLGAAVGSEELKRQSGGIAKTVRKWLSWNSQLYVLARNFFYYSDLGGRLSLRANDRLAVQAGQLAQYRRSEAEGLWTKTFSYLAKLEADCRAGRVPLVIARIPLKLEIDPAEYARVTASGGAAAGGLDLELPRRTIEEFCSRQNIPFLDPVPALRARQPSKACYFVYDGHWNAEGIRVSVESFARQWRQYRLPPWAASRAKLAQGPGGRLPSASQDRNPL